MAAVVHMVRPGSEHTFTDYVSKSLMTFFSVTGNSHCKPVDAIWDTYPEDNLKTLTHQRCGLGARTRIGDGQTRIPKEDWNTGFLKNTDNKRELFSFLSEHLVKQKLDGRLILNTSNEVLQFFPTANKTYLVSSHVTTLRLIQG